MARPPFATILTDIVNYRQSGEINALTGFFEGPGKWGIFAFLAGKAREGQTTAGLHIDTRYNPLSQSAGYATLSGELAVINAPPTPGVVERNGIGWVFLGDMSRFNDNVSVLTIEQYQAIVLDLITDLTVNENLTITYVMGATMTDMQISWPQ